MSVPRPSCVPACAPSHNLQRFSPGRLAFTGEGIGRVAE